MLTPLVICREAVMLGSTTVIGEMRVLYGVDLRVCAKEALAQRVVF